MADQPVAIITGAGGGIGRAIAIELATHGHAVVLVGRTEQTLRETAELLEQPSLVIPADITNVADVTSIVARALATFGRIDVLVNNAGIAPVLSIEQTTPEIWHEVIDTNLSAPYYLCRAVWPTLMAQKSGVIVNISSMAAKDPFPGFLAYGAAKAGLNTFGLPLAREGAAIGVRVYTIAPGAVETAMLRTIVTREQLPTEQTLSAGDIAAAVRHCVTGETAHQSGDVIWLVKHL